MKKIALLLTAALSCGQTPSLPVAAVDNAFRPETIHIRSGQPIRLEFRNEGTVLHDWNVAVKGRPAAMHKDHVHESAGEPASLHVMASPGQTTRASFEQSAASHLHGFWSAPAHHGPKHARTKTLAVSVHL